MGEKAKKLEDYMDELIDIENTDGDVIPLREFEPVPPETLMIIEDDATARRVLEQITKSIFKNIHSFESVEDAQSFLDDQSEDFHVDVLIADYFLPGEHGSVMATKMKKLSKDTKTYVISGSLEEISNELNFHWVDEVFPKPVCYDLLLRELKK